jgi:muramidase (phage lysozyme)
MNEQARINLELLKNPNVRRYLDFIGQAEGADYATLFGGKQMTDFSRHPNIRAKFKETTGKENVTTAAGKYQFLNSTWNGLQKQLDLKDFSPQSQDLAAIELLKQSKSLGDIVAGNFGQAIQKTGKVWASLPSSTYNQGKRSWQWAAEKLGLRNGGPEKAPQTQTTQTPQDMPPQIYSPEEIMPQTIPLANFAPQQDNFFDMMSNPQPVQEEYAPMQIRYALSNMWDDAEVNNG